jgi:hypothetical protein
VATCSRTSSSLSRRCCSARSFGVLMQSAFAASRFDTETTEGAGGVTHPTLGTAYLKGTRSRLASANVATTRILLSTGDLLEVDAPLEVVVKELENAARSSAGTLAQLTQADGRAVAVNAALVVMVRESDA